MGDSESSSLVTFVKQFHQLQAQRVETYGLFEQGFTAYLKAAPNYNFDVYKVLVNEITNTFNDLSQEIMNIGKMISCHERQDLSDIIERIQALEQEKLKITAENQLTRQDQVDHPETDVTNRLKEQTDRLKQLVEEINEELETFKYSCEGIYDS